MLQIVTGPFHPDLEIALVEDVRRFKIADPLAPLAIVVPSDALRQRLKWLLCIEHGLALVDVHFLTFHQLAIRLLTEKNAFDPSTVRPAFFFHELVHHLLHTNPENSDWSALTDMPGAWAALTATLRDLGDGGIDLDRAGEAFSLVQSDAPRSTASLLTLYRSFLISKIRLRACDQDDLALSAQGFVAQSSFLARLHRILYYGFYDLTQVQLDLFQEISRAFSTTLYFPLIKGAPAYLFAERFFERYILGLTHEPVRSVHRDGSPPLSRLFEGPAAHESHDGPVQLALYAPHRETGPASRIVSVPGPQDEVTVVAKDILSLVEERDYAFRDIGVIARTLTGYETVIPRVFHEHGIPFTMSLGRPLAAFPLVKAVMQLLDIRVSNFRRDLVIDWLSSPFIRLDTICLPGSTPRPDLWDLASRRLGITKGFHEWQRLEAFVERDLPLRDFDDEEGHGPRIPAQQVGFLWHAVASLAAELNTMPDSATWGEHADRLHALAERWLDPLLPESHFTDVSQWDLLDEQFQKGFAELRQLERIQPEVTLADFASALRRLMEGLMVPISATTGDTVQVLDAMAARGLSFRALFVLGLNDQVFPRRIQEDAFLRDQTRRSFEVDLGFKISEKLTGYDEELLLFYLLCNSAREHLTLLYQRADERGRPLSPSAYVADVKRRLGDGEITVPRRLSKKFHATPQYRSEWLTQCEWTVKLLLERRVPRRLADIHPLGMFIERGLRALQQQESMETRLGLYDGITGPLERFWERIKTRGISASALQHYAACPFRYYAEHVLRLDPLRLPETIDQINALELGTLAHGILRRCFQSLYAQGYFTRSAQRSVDPRAVLEDAARFEYEQFARTHPVGYPLVWKRHQENLLDFLKEVLREDLAEVSAHGWQPILFEEKVNGTLTLCSPEATDECPISGRLDRVDWSPNRNAYRIIDYKFKGSAASHTFDRNLPLGAVRGRRLQPPLYLMMGQSSLSTRMPGGPAPPTCEGVWFYYLAQHWEEPFMRVLFPGDAWTSDLRQSLTHTIRHLLTGIQSGHFFLFEDKQECERCEYRLLCRRTHQATIWRARTNQSFVKRYREIRKSGLPDDDRKRFDMPPGQNPKLRAAMETEPPSERDA